MDGCFYEPQSRLWYQTKCFATNTQLAVVFLGKIASKPKIYVFKKIIELRSNKSENGKKSKQFELIIFIKSAIVY